MDRRPAALKISKLSLFAACLNGIDRRRLLCWRNILICDVSKATDNATATRLCTKLYGGRNKINVGTCFVCSGPSSGRAVTTFTAVTVVNENTVVTAVTVVNAITVVTAITVVAAVTAITVLLQLLQSLQLL